MNTFSTQKHQFPFPSSSRVLPLYLVSWQCLHCLISYSFSIKTKQHCLVSTKAVKLPHQTISATHPLPFNLINSHPKPSNHAPLHQQHFYSRFSAFCALWFPPPPPLSVCCIHSIPHLLYAKTAKEDFTFASFSLSDNQTCIKYIQTYPDRNHQKTPFHKQTLTFASHHSALPKYQIPAHKASIYSITKASLPTYWLISSLRSDQVVWDSNIHHDNRKSLRISPWLWSPLNWAGHLINLWWLGSRSDCDQQTIRCSDGGNTSRFHWRSPPNRPWT